MKTKYILLLVLTAALCHAAYAQHDLESKGVVLTRQGYDYTVNFTLADYSIKSQNVSKGKDGSETFTFIDVPEYGITYEEGKPQLPQVSFFLAIPSDMDKPKVRVTDMKTKSIDVSYRIYPTQHVMANETLETRKFVIDETEYSGREVKNSPLVDVSEPIVVSGVRGVRVTIFPFQYNPAGKNLTVRTNAKFTIKVGKPIDVKVAHTESMDEYLNAFFENYSDCYDAPEENPGNSILKSPAGATAQYPKGNYMLIVPWDYYSDPILRFIEHKKSMGYNVYTCAYNGKMEGYSYFNNQYYCMTMTSPTTIEAAIKARYNNLATRPEYVLLVGDHTDMPSWEYNVDGEVIYSDLGYAQLEGGSGGNDLFADVKFGRWPISNEQELENIVNKTITMENKFRASHIFPKKCTFIADHDPSSPTHYTGYSFRESITDVQQSFRDDGYSDTFISKGQGGTTNDITNNINSGTYIILYSGHGSFTSWGGSYFSNYYVNQLTNTIYPIVFSNACETANFIHACTANVCLGEVFIRSQHGACAFWGATRVTEIVSTFYLNKYMFNIGFKQTNSIAGIINIGVREMHRLHLLNLFSYFRQQDIIAVIAFNLFGDPSLQVRYNDCEADFEMYSGATDAGETLQYRPATNITIAGDIPYDIPNNYTVKSGGNLTLKANNCIMLKPGFTAQTGSRFSASTTSEVCTQSSSASLIGTSSTTTPLAIVEKSHMVEPNTLMEVYPNPFSESFTLTFSCAAASNVSIHLYDIGGALIKTIAANAVYEEGKHQLTVKGDEQVPGIYFLQIIINQKNAVQKLIKN